MAAPTLRSPLGITKSPARDLASPWRHVDLLLVGGVAAITALSLLMVYSAPRNQQAVTALVGRY